MRFFIRSDFLCFAANVFAADDPSYGGKRVKLGAEPMTVVLGETVTLTASLSDKAVGKTITFSVISGSATLSTFSTLSGQNGVTQNVATITSVGTATFQATSVGYGAGSITVNVIAMEFLQKSNEENSPQVVVLPIKTNPYPQVTIVSPTSGDFDADPDGQTATVIVEGEIRDLVADITGDGSADIYEARIGEQTFPIVPTRTLPVGEFGSFVGRFTLEIIIEEHGLLRIPIEISNAVGRKTLVYLDLYFDQGGEGGNLNDPPINSFVVQFPETPSTQWPIVTYAYVEDKTVPAEENDFVETIETRADDGSLEDEIQIIFRREGGGALFKSDPFLIVSGVRGDVSGILPVVFAEHTRINLSREEAGRQRPVGQITVTPDNPSIEFATEQTFNTVARTVGAQPIEGIEYTWSAPPGQSILVTPQNGGQSVKVRSLAIGDRAVTLTVRDPVAANAQPRFIRASGQVNFKVYCPITVLIVPSQRIVRDLPNVNKAVTYTAAVLDNYGRPYPQGDTIEYAWTVNGNAPQGPLVDPSVLPLTLDNNPKSVKVLAKRTVTLANGTPFPFQLVNEFVSCRTLPQLSSPVHGETIPNLLNSMTQGEAFDERRADGKHRGIDFSRTVDPNNPNGTIPIEEGRRINAVWPGRVVVPPETPEGGKEVIIIHGNGIETRYGHLHKIANGLQSGATVNAGDQIGEMGKTGQWSGNKVHLHFEIRLSPVSNEGIVVDPRRGPWEGEPTKFPSHQNPAPILDQYREGQ